ncbi:MAG: septum formation inhibitor Maf [Clostridia bacterium]|nr:septum formation inhibitor Maf [Clostridia bacterium]
MKIILASASPRRKTLMDLLGLDFEVVIGNIKENTVHKAPENIVCDLSYQKALDVSKKLDKEHIIIGADTIVAYDNQILGKPKSKKDAVNMLKKLSGNTHSVYTGFTIIRNSDGKTITDYEKSDVTFYNIADSIIEKYVNTGEPMDKAGAYSIQGIASSFIKNLKGDYNNVVGLPIYKVSKYLYSDFNILDLKGEQK